MRDLPNEIPDEIAFMIRGQWGDMQAFADAIKLPYTSVYSVLTTGGGKAAGTLTKLAEPFGKEPSELAEILLKDVGKYRDWWVKDFSGGITQAEWAERSGVSQSCISKLIANEENLQIRNLWTIAEALDMDISHFADVYAIHAQQEKIFQKTS